MAMGTSPGRLTRLLLAESSVIALIGVTLGVVAGALVTLYFQFHGIDLAGASEIMRQYGISGRLYPRLSLLSASIGPCAVLVITALAALYPALKVRRLRPVEALAYT
jgi:putative ABC transport system permease protein